MNCIALRKIYLFISLLFVALDILGGTIRGRAVDAVTGQPVVGAMLIIEYTKLYNVSGLDGSYRIQNVPTGTQKIRISCVSNRIISCDIVIESDSQIVTLDVPTESESTQQCIYRIWAHVRQKTNRRSGRNQTGQFPDSDVSIDVEEKIDR